MQHLLSEDELGKIHKLQSLVRDFRDDIKIRQETALTQTRRRRLRDIEIKCEIVLDYLLEIDNMEYVK